jgi:hypothetical protein
MAKRMRGLYERGNGLVPSHKVKAVDMLDDILNENSTSHVLHNLGRD